METNCVYDRVKELLVKSLTVNRQTDIFVARREIKYKFPILMALRIVIYDDL